MDALNVINIGTDKVNALLNMVVQYGAAIGLKLLVAALLWIVGRWSIGMLVRMLQRSLTRQKFDPTVLRYLGSFVTVTLNIILVVAILSYFGIETTSFAALLAAVGLAIGMAWSGLLANLAAGGFIIVLRPFKVGDVIAIADVSGRVDEIGLFVTAIDTAENVRVLVGNNKILSSNIINYSTNDYRRVELSATLPASVDEQQTIARLTERLQAIPNVLATPKVDVQVAAANADNLTLAVRPYCHNDHYWPVYYQATEVIRRMLQEEGARA
ncbi:mechanosensitive ion channel family protein [Pseudomonas sp. DTU_2021_1001937_2_SI_NGA_ILE_001]|uniref:mechanosensitive ion channel family protein n=1 Tax=Pseudomonas sp. DTU_2021_1001937_2_SI_NGA_ILE_001 TaxID=3077589 RepID=UPI0028FC0DAB|nr:mechanosensitive ion channel family protein [Pseudomonas sp. DTU_2021_1001937_2_SI_NGA_ILE_001]WNW12486.1 mechanosensitive ion channel family protein [Pseudomonas sp. DTU_2021_1001937_2_SI_NGA_ILE_001]